MTGAGKHTPIMKQYFAAKATQPDAVLFFRLGDFYEMFHEDAVIVSRELDLTLTSRNKNAAEEVPMAGVPYHAAHGYIARLLAKGYKVAICEQMADPAKTRGIVPREIVRVITPSLVTDADQLDARQNTYLAAIEPDGDGFGIALFDLSTGELRVSRLDDGASLMGEIVRAAPREVLLGDITDDARAALTQVVGGAPMRADGALSARDGHKVLTELFGEEEVSLASRSLPSSAQIAAARVVRFAQACSPGRKLPVRRIDAWDAKKTLVLDDVAQKHLDLVAAADGGREGSLIALVDQSCTPGGARLLRRRLLAPLLDVAQIRRRHDAVDLFVNHPAVRAELRAGLEHVGDLERLAVRAALLEATPKELGSLRDSLAAVPDVLTAIASIPDTSASETFGLSNEPIDALGDLQELLNRALVERPPALARDGGIFREGFDELLDESRALQSSGTKVLGELEQRLRNQTGATTLKIKYTRVFGHYIEVTGKHLGKVPTSWRRKQTVAGGERYTNEELDSLSDRILNAEERAKEQEATLYKELLANVAKASPRVHRLAQRISDWDVHAALADVAHRYDFVRPEVDNELGIELTDSRHPVVERLAAAGQFVPNDVLLDADGERMWLITGPNMSGKSTLMRQVALIVILAQSGSFVPAAKARIGLVDRILSRVGASDNVARGESTFMVEMRETSSILRSASRRSLVILDEIGRGTSTYDGLAIAWAVAEHLHDVVQCRALFATHYHELTDLTKQARSAANHSVSAQELGDDIVFLHKLQTGAASRSYGIAVARLAGLPESVLSRAKAILGSLESAGALPSGAPSTLRRREKNGRVQLDLFSAPQPEPQSSHPALETLRAVEPERLSPIEALQLVMKLKGMVQLRRELALPRSARCLGVRLAGWLHLAVCRAGRATRAWPRHRRTIHQ